MKQLKDLLLREQSRANTNVIIEIILSRPELFEELWKLVIQNKDPLSRRAAWAADYCAEINPDFLNGRLENLTILLTGFRHDGLKRHALRMISRSPLPAENIGHLMETCFLWLESAKESVAVKMYSMMILYRISSLEPDIRRELHDIIEIQMPEATPGLQNIGRKIMKKLQTGL